MIIKKILRNKGTDVETVSPKTSVLEAAQILTFSNIGLVVVCDDERRVAGIFASILLAVLVLLGLTTHAKADFMEGWRAYQSGEYEIALQHWTELAEDGDPVAQYNVGVMYDEGAGVDRDDAKVIAWWNKAAAQGHQMAQHNLALLYIELGSQEDFGRAANWLKRAAENGFVLSQYSLAKLFATGFGVEKDNARALTLFLKAGKAGFVKAQYNLGKIYRDGIGVEVNQEVSMDWFRKAAFQGYAKAQEKIASRLARGVGVKSDVIEALKWSILAIRQGRTSTQKIFDDLRKNMNAKQVAEAEKRARIFRPLVATYQ